MSAGAEKAVLEVKRIGEGKGPKKIHEHDEHMAAFILGGATRSRAGGVSIEAAAGQLVLISAGVPHECRPLNPESWRYTLFLIEPGASDSLDGALRRAEAGAIVVDAEGTAIEALAAAGSRAERGAVVEALEGAVARTLRRCSSRPGDASAQPPSDSKLVEIETELRRRIRGRASLDELARRAKMDKYELVRDFKASYGLAPYAYLLNLKINEAKALLRSGASPAEAAFECGFCDQSHFTRAFTRRVGLPPAEYARTYKT